MRPASSNSRKAFGTLDGLGGVTLRIRFPGSASD